MTHTTKRRWQAIKADGRACGERPEGVINVSTAAMLGDVAFYRQIATGFSAFDSRQAPERQAWLSAAFQLVRALKQFRLTVRARSIP